MPLWLVAAPVAMAYAVAAGKAGLTAFELQVMSLFVYSAPTQMSMVPLWSSDSSASMVLLMVVLAALRVRSEFSRESR
jgi:predicted branched-subunit amino acid permease